MQQAVEAEIARLDGHQGEPAWPLFPPRLPAVRRGIRLSIDRNDEDEAVWFEPEDRVDLDGAALSLHQIAQALDIVKEPWIPDFVEAYGDWTATANGPAPPAIDLSQL
jgi:hypothetical protein